MTSTEFEVAPARWELSESEIIEAYGPLIQGAIAAFGQDSSYLVDMAEHASQIVYKRRLWQARTEANNRLKGTNPDSETVKETAAAILDEWGVRQPTRFSRTTRRRRASVLQS